ncbi:MAG TPA: response regulator transcription factor [Acidimicrobiales bacterium]|nr:response regulator transcription factor [Acidimicrobiales bacterium]
MAPEAPSILLVDDHAVIAAPLAMALQASGFGTVAAADPDDLSTEAVVEQARRIGADIVLLDLHLGRGRIGVPMVEPLRRTGAKVLLFTAAADPDLIAGALKAGAEAVVDKAMPFHGLVGAINAVASGETLIPEDERAALIEALDRREGEQDARLRPFRSLTDREEAILRDLVDGRSPKEIARADRISVSTVRGHIASVLGKLGVNSQREALALARAAGWPPA